MWPFPNENQLKTKVKAIQEAQADQSVQAWGAQKVKEVATVASPTIPVNASVQEVMQAMQKVFEEEKQAMRQAFSEEVGALNAANQQAMAAILNGLNQLQEGTKAATAEIEAKFAAEFTKEMNKHMSADSSVPPASKGQRFKNFRDMGNYVDVENKRD